jgi:hypothetical protein
MHVHEKGNKQVKCERKKEKQRETKKEIIKQDKTKYLIGPRPT